MPSLNFVTGILFTNLLRKTKRVGFLQLKKLSGRYPKLNNPVPSNGTVFSSDPGNWIKRNFTKCSGKTFVWIFAVRNIFGKFQIAVQLETRDVPLRREKFENSKLELQNVCKLCKHKL